VSATLVALVTLNCFVDPAVAELEFIPEFALPAALLVAEAASPVELAPPVLAVAVALPAPSCPVT
jgi:hypothetical protein